MKYWTQAAFGVFLAASIVACAGDKRANDNTAGGAAVGTTGASADRDFIEDQLEDGKAEVNLGRLAADRASNPQVKEFAQMMVRDHETAGEELRQAASAANVQLREPPEPDRDHKNAEEELAKLSGAEFDRKYINKMIDEHQEAISEVEKKTDSENTQVRQWAQKVLPKIREHLDRAKQIQQTLEQARS